MGFAPPKWEGVVLLAAGGSVSAGMAIYDAMQFVPCSWTCRCGHDVVGQYESHGLPKVC